MARAPGRPRCCRGRTGSICLMGAATGYQAKLRVRERKHPKLYWTDPGLVRAVKRQLGPTTAEETGPLFEGFVLHLLRAHAEEAVGVPL